MSALRDWAEQQAAPTRAGSKRTDALLLAVDDIYTKIEAVTALLGAEHDEPVENVVGHFVTLRDDQHARGIHEAAERMLARSPEAVDAFLREQEEKKRREPWIPTDRGPRDPNTLSANKRLVQVETGPDGKPVRAWAQDSTDSPLDRY